MALAWEKYTPDVEVLVGRISDFLEAQGSRTEIQEAQNNALKHRIEFLIQETAGMRQRARYLRERLELQNTAVNNFMVLELARLARRETSVMKWLAVLGLVFLPSACIAEIITLPAEVHVNFWMSAAVVTVFLMGICVVTIRARR
ncbi:hypothetical protein QBC38DRAFT_458228 [Podospora fimiseda]|uniref:Uncharacterized protein n=1 Tax=Podospora fimiseda TaxID=252190 RepID=A0AAN7BJB7_9PEZI|nr:hypothetical protein QBC38DRAFT_458228 [Podospora fimiseda]